MRGKKKHEQRQEQAEQQEPPAQREAPAQPGTPAEARVERNRITPVSIQEKEFRPALRGYNERDVDAFLDEVTEEVARLHAENKRLREDMGTQGTTRLDTGATEADGMLREAREAAEGALRDGREEAERTLREAREEAARILAEAQAKAAEGAAATAVSQRPGGPDSFASSRSFINAFLARERDFLQSLAALIQSHAESVKEDIRVSRDQARRGTTGRASSGPSASPAPVRAEAGPGPGRTGPAGGSGSQGGEGGAGGAALDDRLTQPWRPAGLGPDQPVGQGAPDSTAGRDQPLPGAVATSTIAADSAPERGDVRGEAVLDLTKIEEEPSPRDAAAPAEHREAPESEEEESTDRSLRVLL